MNREEWLGTLAERLAPYYESKGYSWVATGVSVACGWPSRGAVARKSRRLGECWKSAACADGRRQIFVSPTIDLAGEVANVLAHELLHACLPDDAGHAALFKGGMKALGFQGPAKQAVPAPDGPLAAELAGILAQLPPYPNSALRPAEQHRKQSVRMRKLACPSMSHEAYILRASQKVIELGVPNCPVCLGPLEVEQRS